MLALLQTRRDWSGAELSDRLAVSERTVRRDIERLRDLGYPVDSLTGPAGGYRLRAGTAMPPLLLDDEEAVAIAVGLRTAAGAGVAGIEETAVRAMVKLEQVLPAHLRGRVQAVAAASTLPPSGPTVDPDVLTLVAAACRDDERLRFDYRDRTGADARRDVEPHALGHVGYRWYLVAWDRRRDAWRTFRLDRITRPMAAGTRFAPRPIPGGDAAGFIARNRSAVAPRYEADLTLHASAAEMADRRNVWGHIEPIDEHRCRFRTGDHDLDWLALRIAMLRVDFDLHGPPELVAHMSRLAGRLQRATGD